MSSTSSPLPNLRRIVTKHESDKAIIASDQSVPSQPIPNSQGIFAAPLWATNDSVPTKDNHSDGSDALKGITGLVHPNGTALRYTDLAPGRTTPTHRTNSVDYNILICGEVVHRVDADGEESYLKTPGDTLVQRGTLHSWRNPSETVWARWVTVVVAAEAAVVEGKALEEAWIDV